MPRPTENPVTTKIDGPLGDSVTTHPAFAMVGASRVSGSANLYGSDFRHHHFMVIRICRSQLNRGLSRDWHHGLDELIEVALSEAQWATFVSAPNVGFGVPCTLHHVGGVDVPGIPDPETRTSQFGREMAATIADGMARLDALAAKIEAMGLPKGKAAALAEEVEGCRRELSANVPFVAKQFDEHMETGVERAKTEVHGYMVGALVRAGIAANAGTLPLQIEERPTLAAAKGQGG